MNCAIYLYCILILPLSLKISWAQEGTKGPLSGEEQGEGEEQGVGEADATGKSGSSFKNSPNKYKLACSHVKSSLEDILFHYDEMTDVFRDFKQRYLSTEELYIHDKAKPTHKGSMCPMNISCCTSRMEKEVMALSRNEFKIYYDNIIKAHSESCPPSGKRLFKSSRIIMDIIMKNLEIRVNESLEGSLPEDTFANLTLYLSYFSAIADTCPLQQLVKDQLESLVKVALGQIFANNDEFSGMLEDPISNDCMKNTTMELVKDYYLDILSSMQKQLHDLGQFVRALKMAGHALNVIRSHALSESCITGIIRMQYCSMCGGYGRFSPCLNLCVNTLRGCFADLAEIHGPFKHFTTLLRTLSKGLIEDFKPDNFVDKYLKHFVGVVNYLKQNQDALEERLTQECSTNDYDAPDEEITQSRRRRSIFQPVQESTHAKKIDPLVEQIDFKDMRTVMEAELVCLERLAKIMAEVPEDICGLGKHKISQGGNTQCWTGKTLGEYQYSLAGLLKKDQLQNPVYSNLALDTEVLYSPLIHDISAASDTLNRTVAFRERCQESDDEDCAVVLFNQCFDVDVEIGSGSGSGSGSGFGSGSGSGYMDGMEDYEIPTMFTEMERSRVTTATEESTDSSEVTKTDRDATEVPTTDSFTIGTIIIESERDTSESPSEETTEGTTEDTPTEGTTIKPLFINNELGVFLPFPKGAAPDGNDQQQTETTTTQVRQTTTIKQMTHLMTTKQETTQQAKATTTATTTTATTTTTTVSNPTETPDNTGHIDGDAKELLNKKLPESTDPAPDDIQGTDSKIIKQGQSTESHQNNPSNTNKVDSAFIISSSASLHSVQYTLTSLTLLFTTAITFL